LRTALDPAAGTPSEKGRITSAIYEAGFGSSSRAYAMVNDQLGMTPSAFRSGGAGEEIRYGTATTRLGVLLVARTSRGVCAIEFGDDAAAVRTRLADRFSRAGIIEDQRTADAALQIVARYIDEANDVRLPRLPLDIVGTAFQRRVWEALMKIPVGETSTYAELATKIGHPRAVRAVAAACAANPVAVAVPCHRAVRSDGALGGYRWGLARNAIFSSARPLLRGAAVKTRPPGRRCAVPGLFRRESKTSSGSASDPLRSSHD